MNTMLLRATLAMVLAASPIARAQPPSDDGLTLAQRRNCMACHAVNATLMGPSFHAIAGKYASHAGAAGELAQTIIHGSVDVWGPVPMPANTQLTEAEAGALARWILTQR